MASFLDQFNQPDHVPTPATLPPGWEPTPFAAGALGGEIASLLNAQEGSRNDALNRAAFNLAQIVAGGEISFDHVHEALTLTARQIGLGEVEIARTIRSGFARSGGRARNGTGAPVRPLEGLPTLDPTPSPYLDLRALWEVEAAQEWICEPLVAPGRQTVLYSAPKVGKSLLALQLVVAISQGTDTLGCPTVPTHVLYLDFENDPVHDIRARLIEMDLGPDAFDNVSYACYPEVPPLDTQAGSDHVARMIDATGAGLVVIDTIGRAVIGEENSNDTWLNVYRLFGLMLKRKGVALLRLDHSGKDESKGQRGASAKLGDVDLVWHMSEVVAGESYRLDLQAQRMYTSETAITLRRTQQPLGHHVDTRSSGRVREEAVLRILDEAGLPLAAGRVVAQKALDAVGFKIRTATLADIVKRRRGVHAELD